MAREPWCDRDRLGCVGASYGGYSVYFLAGCHQKRFKAFIAHCGIFNFESMYGQTEELFFINHDYGGAYWEKDNPTAMRSYANSPHKFVDRWDTPILIVTGEYDFRIPYTQSLEAFTAARLHGIPARLTKYSSRRTRWSGTANSSAGSTNTSRRPGSLFRRAPHRERTPPDRDAFPMSFYDYSDLFMMKNGVFVEIFSYILSNRLFLYTN